MQFTYLHLAMPYPNLEFRFHRILIKRPTRTSLLISSQCYYWTALSMQHVTGKAMYVIMLGNYGSEGEGGSANTPCTSQSAGLAMCKLYCLLDDSACFAVVFEL